MHRLALLLLVALGSPTPSRASAGQAYLNPDQPIDRRVQDLIGRLTLEEKAALLNHRGPGIPRLGIESDGWNQCLNGVKWDRPTTLFPACIALSATWNTNLVHEIAAALSDEARAIYNAWHQDPAFQGEKKGLIYRAPVINIGRNPYWGRNHEAWGEDPFLTSRMAVAYITGLQGDDPHYVKIASTLKHYAVNNVEGGRSSLDVQVPERCLREYWLPHFRDGVVEGKACSVMASYNGINGTPNQINRWLLTDVLKNEWRYEGFVVSDLGGVRTMVEGHTKRQMTYADAVAASIMAGCDLSDREFMEHIPVAVRAGKLSQERLDDALSRVLRVRFRLGAFDPQERVPFASISTNVIACPRHRTLALKAAQQSIVLLQNNAGLLPLARDRLKSVAVIGPQADRIITNNYNGKYKDPVTPLRGFQNRLGPDCDVRFASGGDADAEIERAADLAARSDAAILFIGTDGLIEQEGKDRKMLGLPPYQERLAEKVVSANARTVVVLMSAGPLTVPWLKAHAPAILQAWWPGEEGGHAIADVILGKVNPAGRLPHTVYASDHQVPPRDDYDISKGFTYMYLNGDPLFPFGHGLSYTRFRYSQLHILSEQIALAGKAVVTVEVENVGDRAGDEVVQLYARDCQRDGRRPAKRLCAFQRISLRPGEKKTVRMDVPYLRLAIYDEASRKSKVNPGAYRFMVGSSSSDIRLTQQVEVK